MSNESRDPPQKLQPGREQRPKPSDLADPQSHRFSFAWWHRLILGNPIPTSQADETRLPKLLALPVFSSDAISSVAYATQEILLALGAAGLAAASQHAAYTRLTWGVASAIVCLLIIVAFSYRQTIFAYPSGGGSYIVSKANLGVNWGLIAAAALLIDYVLTVAVSIASGVQNLVGTPALHFLGHSVVLVCIVFVSLLTVANLRGLRQAGALFAIPTYLFIALTLVMVLLGAFGEHLGWHVYREAINQDIPGSVAGVTHAVRNGLGAMGLLVVLRAFANGCSAMTGTEAISNGIPAFQKDESKNAATTLLMMAGILGTLFIGISYLSTHLHVVYWEHNGQTAPAVIDQLSSAVFGRTGGRAVLYYAMQIATATILVLAANTSFADFPRLASILAGDRFLPISLSHRGDRLVYSSGIVALGVFASALLFLFRGNVDRLIPLYALGVFTAFTLSQIGMVLHWRREKGKGWHAKAAVNGLGAVATGMVFCVVLYEKFPEGAWMVVVMAALLVWMFHVIHGHYERIIDSLRFAPGEAPGLQISASGDAVPADTGGNSSKSRLVNHVLVLVNRPHRGIVPALRYARLLDDNFEVVYVEIEPDRTDDTKKEWHDTFPDLNLTVLPSPYRSLVQPLLSHIEDLRQGAPPGDADADPAGARGLVTVILPQYFTEDFWGFLLENTAGPLLKLGLRYRDDVVVTNVRYRVKLPAV